jgi:4-aminobutyrate aminotransferase
MALKLARLVTGRFKTISLWDSFHGATLDAISIGGEAQFRDGVGPLLPGAEHVPPCEPSGCPFRCGRECSLSCADYIEYVLGREPGIGAVIGETLRCTPSIPPADYWKRIRAACDRHGALLILDEIPIGLGRTGKMFACENFGVTPDILVLGKGLGGGVMPLAAILVREEFNQVAAASLGHFTHEKNPVSAAAGLATLDILQEGNLPAHAATLGAEALADLRELASRHPIIHGVRGLGLMLGIDVTGAPAGFADEVMYAALRRGLNFKTTRGHMLTLTPPVNLSRAEWKQALAILDASLTECTAPRG